MANKGKQLRFELERKILLLLRQARARGVGVFLRGHPALDKVARELVTLHPNLFAGLSETFAGDRLYLLLEQHRKRENWSRKQSGANEQSNTSNTGLCIQQIKANWNGGRRLATASSTPHVRRRKRSSSSRSPSSCAVRRRAVSWSNCSWTRRWLILNHETVKQTPPNRQRNAKQFSSTASNGTPPAVLKPSRVKIPF